jgi:hypothetical protein
VYHINERPCLGWMERALIVVLIGWGASLEGTSAFSRRRSSTKP